MIINEKYFKEYSPIPLNYNMKELKNYIKVATEIWLRPLIGTDLLDEIEEQVENNTVSQENATLLTTGGLWQYLCYATCYEGLAFIWAHCSEVGITLAESDNSKSITLKDLTYINEHLRRQTEFLKDSVKRFICEYYLNYPKADVCACGCDCCNRNPKLNAPNPMNELYTTLRKITDLK
jgi:hypothetical protein